MTTHAQFRERWALGCVLYLLLFNVPILLIFNGSRPLFGVPGLLCYLFVSWLVFIALCSLFARSLGRKRRQGGEDP